MGKHVGFRYFIAWSSPYSQPPEGKPTLLAEMYESLDQREKRYLSGDLNPTPESFSSIHIFGDGYAIYIQPICTPSKQLSKDTLKSIRRKRLERKSNTKYPLFSEQIIQEEIEKNPSYFEGITRPDLQAGVDEAIQNELTIYKKFLEMTKEA